MKEPFLNEEPENKTGQLKKAKQRAFLAAYECSASVVKASDLAGVSRSAHYAWLKSDPGYAAAFEEANEVACEVLEDEATRRALRGVEEPVIYQGEECFRKALNPATGKWENTDAPLTIRRYSDTLLIFLLKGRRPQKYRDNWSGEIAGPNGSPIDNNLTIRFVQPAERPE